MNYLEQVNIIDPPAFPYLLDVENVSSSEILILHQNEKLFRITGGLFTSEPSSSQTTSVELIHPFAKTVLREKTNLAKFVLQNLVISYMAKNSILFNGWLTEIRFYPEQNPFSSAEREDNLSNHNANTGYPALPPKIVFPNLTLPLQVEVKLTY